MPVVNGSESSDKPAAVWATRRKILLLAGGAVVLGILAGVLWWLVVALPSYTVDGEGRATMRERDLVMIFAMDAYYVILGLVVGLLLGIFAAFGLGRRLGWLSVPIAVGAALVSAGLCWGTGWLLGPGSFKLRLERAQPGDHVPVELTLTSWTAITVWVFAAVLPMLVWATAAKDPENARPIFRAPKRVKLDDA